MSWARPPRRDRPQRRGKGRSDEAREEGGMTTHREAGAAVAAAGAVGAAAAGVAGRVREDAGSSKRLRE